MLPPLEEVVDGSSGATDGVDTAVDVTVFTTVLPFSEVMIVVAKRLVLG